MPLKTFILRATTPKAGLSSGLKNTLSAALAFLERSFYQIFHTALYFGIQCLKTKESFAAQPF